MMRSGESTWTAAVEIEPGAHDYMFLIDGRAWIPDPRNPRIRPGNHHSRLILRSRDDVPINFTLRLVPYAAEFPARSQGQPSVAGEFTRWQANLAPLEFDSARGTWRGTFGAPVCGSDLNLVDGTSWSSLDLDGDPRRFFFRPGDPGRFSLSTGFRQWPIVTQNANIPLSARLLAPTDSPELPMAGFRATALLNNAPLPVEFDLATGLVVFQAGPLRPGLNSIIVEARNGPRRAEPAVFHVIREPFDNAPSASPRALPAAWRQVAFSLAERDMSGFSSPTSVAVAGSFNNWNLQGLMLRRDQNRVWRAEVALPPGQHEYKFVIDGGEWMADPLNPRTVGPYGNSLRVVEGDATAGNAHVSARARDAILYQVMTPRFADSDGDGIGDLTGLISRIDYIRDLGVNWIYLLPIFESPSQHGYHTTDYGLIDRDYGSFADFSALLEVAHQSGIRVMLDYVINHSSADHPFFRLAYSDPASPFRSWYRFQGAGGWEGFGGNNNSMPRWNFDHAPMRRYAIDVAQYWQSLGVDGFRCDVAHAVPDDFWLEWSTALKKRDPDVLLFPEFDEPYFDLYYDFSAMKIFEAVATQDPRPLDALMATEDAMGKIPVRFLDYHDKDRALTLAGGDRGALLLGAALLLTAPGVPMLYYGQELGMEGLMDDNTNREMMDWECGDYVLRDAYRRLIRLRRDHEALRRGDMRRLEVSGAKTFAFARATSREEIAVILNLERQARQVTVDLSGVSARTVPQSLLGDHPEMHLDGGGLRLRLAPLSAAILGWTR
jgi:glycosidase